LVDFKYWKWNFNLLNDRNKLTSCKKENKFQVLVLGELYIFLVKNEKMKVLTCQKSCFKHKWMISKKWQACNTSMGTISNKDSGVIAIQNVN
jgi:hypothetical protein